MPGSPAGNRYGARGGNWLPQLVDGQPFGKIKGVRKTCPTPVLVGCWRWCRRWWVHPSQVGQPCHVCGEPYQLVEVEPGRVA